MLGQLLGATIFIARSCPHVDRKKIKAAKPKEKIYKLYDAEGLYLEVPVSGKRRWRLKYRFNGKEKRINLGTYPDVSLLKARRKRDEARRELTEGHDPSTKRKIAKAKALTFESMAREWVEKKGAEWAPRHRKTVTQRLESYVFPHLGDKAISEIAPLDVLAMLRIIEARGAVHAAKRTLGICSQVCRFAVASARLESDPCRDLAGALATRKPKHFAAITDPKEVGALMRSINGYGGAAIVRWALQFLALTFVRPGEIRGATWDEINIDAAEWVIPLERMKMRKAHIVPLSTQALQILEKVQPIATSPTAYVFPSVRIRSDRPLSENTLLYALRGMGYPQGTMTAHGFRAMASTLLNAKGYSPDVIERQLAHAEKNQIRAAYHRTQYLEERKEMMQGWADYLDELTNDR